MHFPQDFEQDWHDCIQESALGLHLEQKGQQRVSEAQEVSEIVVYSYYMHI